MCLCSWRPQADVQARGVWLVLVTLIVAGIAGSARAAEYFIAPNGSPTAAGTIEDPWDIYKLDSSTAAAPGDTVWLRGGTYYYPTRDDGQKGFGFDLRGEPNNPITIRNYNGERAIIDGGFTSTYRNPEHVIVWGLEVTVSESMEPNDPRSSSQSTSWPTDLDRPYGGMELGGGTGIYVRNCYIHHGQKGFGWWDSLGYESSINGCVVWSNGWIAPDRSHGHGVYAQNATGSMRYITESMFLENYASPMQIYGSSAAVVDDFTYRGNICVPHPEPSWGHKETHIAAGWYRTDHYFDDNICYRTPVWVGYDVGGYHVEITNNKLIRSYIRQEWGSFTNLVTTGNVVWGGGSWSDPPIVDLRENDFEPDRANLCLIQPGGSAATIAVDFGPWLAGGSTFELRDPKDLWGPPVFTGVYAGSSIDVPVGGKEFSVFVAFKVGNAGLTVDAGTDQQIALPTHTALLDGTVTDNNIPPGGTVTQTWTKDSGPGTVTFAGANSVDTTATFSTGGTYVLRLTADDTEQTASDTVTITLKVNEAPVVDAGASDTVTWPSGTANLDGTVTDDGLPAGGLVTQTWSKVSGPGSVTFADTSAVDTAASFSTFGTYVLSLTANDTARTASDTVTIAYPVPINQAPTVDAGADDRITLSAQGMSLDATVTDDGLPFGQTVTTTWSKSAGPGTVTFANAGAVDTTATFSAIGTYVLQLLADDGALAATDTVTIQVVEAGQSAVILFDMGSNDVPSRPETDGRYWNHLGRAETPNAWDTIVANAVDADNAATGVGLDVYDIQNQNKNLARAGTYPYNVENDGWNYSSAEGSQAIIRITGLNDQESYTLKVHSSWPSDLWWYASGKFTCQGNSHYYDDAGAVIYTWTGLEPTNGKIDLEMNTWLPAGQTPFNGSTFSIELMELAPESNPNEAPIVGAGPDQAIGLPVNTAALDGTVTDDGLPAGGSLTVVWTALSGPGDVTFADAGAADTTATFSAAGTYVLQLYAFDGALSGSDQMTVVVDPANTAPAVSAGADILVGWPGTVATLDGTISDDGLPTAGSLTATWTLAAGPSTVQFGDPKAVDTSVTFTQRGLYVLRLTASDGELAVSDVVGVTVAVEADFDGDGLVTSDDVDMLYAVLDTTVPPTDPMYDLTGDGQITMADAEYLVEVVVGTSMADTNLDMEVDIMDLGNLADVYGATGTFSDGDTNGDGVVGIMDLGNLADDYGKTFVP